MADGQEAGQEAVKEQTELEKRIERNASLKKGSNLVVLRKVKATIDGEEVDVFAPVFGTELEARSLADIKSIMVERDIRGTVLPVRPLDSVTRKVKEVLTFE